MGCLFKGAVIIPLQYTVCEGVISEEECAWSFSGPGLAFRNENYFSKKMDRGEG